MIFTGGFVNDIEVTRNICFEFSVLAPPVVSDVCHFVFGHYISHVNELSAVCEEFFFPIPSPKSQ